MHTDQAPTIVVGGGLAGLTAAATLARAGHAVTVVEGAAHLGGRARSRHRDGFDVNLGPHALYRAAGGLDVLHRLGVRPRGRLPRLDRAGVYVDGEVVSFTRHLRTAVRGRLRVARSFSGLGRGAAAGWAGRPVADWLDHATQDPGGHDLLASLVRTATYSADTNLLDAGAATTQLRAAAHGVLYLHHGWSSLVHALEDVVRVGGGQVLTGTPVEAIEHDDRGVHAVRLADGRALRAAGAVVAVNDPRRAASLLSGDAARRVEAVAEDAIPVRMAHLDLALRPLPSARFAAVFGIDEPVFVTVPSSVADIAPRGGGVVQVARYLRPGEEAEDHRPLLEAVLDAHQPQWRDHVIEARYVPRSLVSGDHARPVTRGVFGRPDPGVAGVPGLAVAGDWVGPTAMLADAAIVSGAGAAERVVADMLGPVHRSALAS